jgi:ATP-dependent DNA ligase
METKFFEILFSNDKRGKPKQWNISVVNMGEYSNIITIYGGVNYRKIETTLQISQGKNLGKSNATTHFEQAIKDAQSKWNKKRDLEGYKTKSDFEPNLQTPSTSTSTPKLPMLAQDFKKQKNKVVYPCYVQPKLDGLRNLYNTTTNQNTTRQGKEYSIIEQSGKLYKELLSLPKGLILDGELYTDKMNFEALGVLRKTKTLTNIELDNLQKIEYHVYDIIDTTLTFEQRNNLIKELHLENYEKIVYVPTFTVSSEKQIQDYHIKFLEQGFEGTMIRNKNSFYTIKQRSSDLLKYKDFQDAEFEIIDFTFEKDTSGDDKNLIVWIIKVSESRENDQYIKCKVRPMGTKEERKELYVKCEKDFNQFKGRKLWVKFFSRTADGSLRFPTSKTNSYTSYIRDEIF